MFKRSYILMLTLILSVFFGCIRDEYPSSCNPGLRVELEYAATRKPIGSEMLKVQAYVFDEYKLFCGEYTREGAVLATDPTITIPVVGNKKYTVLVWGGPMTTFSIGEAINGVIEDDLRVGETTLEEFRLCLNTAGEDPLTGMTLLKQPDMLYYGLTTAEAKTDQLVTVKSYLKKNTSTVRTTVREIVTGSVRSGYTLANEKKFPYRVYITSDNSVNNYLNRIPAGSPVYKYVPYDLSREIRRYTASIDVMRLIVGSKTRLVVEDVEKDRLIADEDLIDLILRHEKYNNQDDIDAENLFEIDFSIERNPNVEVVITINGWVIKKVYPSI